jgi:hypothetical protein
MAAEKYSIDVAASVIADISAGIYRTPAGALKELVSNAFDADAKNVHLSTNGPQFNTFTCTDDGSGLTAERFKEIMGLIGGSTKRDRGELSPVFRRPLIGRIGIGILSIGQICSSFEIFSSARGDRTKFRARIDLEPYMRPEARRTQLGTRLKANEKVRVGEYEIEETEEDPDNHYTRVVMEKINPGFKKQLRSQPMVDLGVTPKTFKKGDMTAFLASVSKDTVAEHGAYAQLIWELAVTTPVRYFPDGPVRNSPKLNDLRKMVEGYKFHVFLDGVELLKPILLPASPSVTHKVYPDLHFRKTLSSSRELKVRGYLYWQNTRILPRELQGILVRVRNVGIGGFDPTYLGYPKHEGWKFSQLCGELYVDEGLDEAINIDRASFRETDEAYLALQEFLFQRLGKETDQGAGVFTNIKALSGKIAQRKRNRETANRAKRATEVIYGSSRAVELKVTEGRTSGGVKVTPHIIRVDKDLLEGVAEKHRELFIGVCGVIEKSLGSILSGSKRRALLEKIAKLFSAQ